MSVRRRKISSNESVQKLYKISLLSLHLLELCLRDSSILILYDFWIILQSLAGNFIRFARCQVSKILSLSKKVSVFCIELPQEESNFYLCTRWKEKFVTIIDQFYTFDLMEIDVKGLPSRLTLNFKKFSFHCILLIAKMKLFLLII